MIDVHGPGASGTPDGKFDLGDDWVTTGNVGFGRTNVQPPDDPKVIRQEWDGRDRSAQQGTTPAPRALSARTYDIRVEIDAFQGNGVNFGDLGYRAVTLTATLDNTVPQISGNLNRQAFSPNGDGFKDDTTLTYTLSEALGELWLEFTNPAATPSVQLPGLVSGQQGFTWNGSDGLSTQLRDGSYTAQLRGTDKGGNVGVFPLGSIQIDTDPPTITQVTPANQTFQQTPISAIAVTFNAGTGSPIDFTQPLTQMTLKDSLGSTVNGQLSNDAASALRLTLSDPLDTIAENGVYTLTVDGSDGAGNRVNTTVELTFDTVAPTVSSLATGQGVLEPGDSVNTTLTVNSQLTFVEATISDNIASSLNLSASTISLTGPQGAVNGTQSLVGQDGLRFTLSVPLATNGSNDGVYNINTTAVDRAGNTQSLQSPFVYDTQIPQLTALSTGGNNPPFTIVAESQIAINRDLPQIVATFSDAAGSGIDYLKTRIEMSKLGADPSDTTPIAGTLTPNLATNTLTFRLGTALSSRDGSQDGVYQLQLTLADIAKNTQTRQFQLLYDTQVPSIVSTTPTLDETINTLSKMTVVLSDPTSGVDFGTIGVRLLRVQPGGGDVEVRTDANNNGVDTVTLSLSKPLAIDGSANGEYAIEITPVDLAGNVGVPVRSRFFFNTKTPEIRLNVPTETRVNTLTTVDAQLFDYIGAGIDFSAAQSTITVSRPDGTQVPARSVQPDEVNRKLIWTIAAPLSRDGSAEGTYTVQVTFADFVGQTFTKNVALTFDTQLPVVDLTEPARSVRVSQLEKVVVKFKPDLSGVDFTAPLLRLLGPDGNPVGGNREHNGVDTVTLHLDSAQVNATPGVYSIEVTSADRAGNVATSPVLFSFTLTPSTPRVILLSPTTRSVNRLEQITATLQNYIGPGLDLNAADTTIRVTDSTGAEIGASSVDVNEAQAQLTWNIATPLPRDGSADGSYTAIITFVDITGATFRQNFLLTFDTLAPTVVSTTPQSNARISQLSEATVVLQDNLSGINFTQTAVQLTNASGAVIPTTLQNDGQKEIRLNFDPFKMDGTADGIYGIEITPVDNAGNIGGLARHEFTYATQVPEINTLTPQDGAVVNRLTAITATLLDRSGQGIDFAASTLTLKNAAGETINGVLRNNEESGGTNPPTLTLEVALPTDGTADGAYTIELRLVDKLGVSASYTRQFTYDSLPPVMVPATQPPQENTIRSNRVSVTFDVTDNPAVQRASLPVSSDDGVFAGSGVDFSTTTVQLTDSNGAQLGGEQSDDGKKAVTFLSAPLPQVGVYTLTVTLADRAGNRSIPQQFRYEYLIDRPRVAEITPQNKADVNRLSQVKVKFEDASGTGIDFSPFTGSTIELRDPSNLIVEGDLSNNGTDEMTLTVKIPLLTNGSDDGIYTIIVTPKDRLGTVGLTRQFTVRYDTQKPQIQSVTHVDLTANISNVNSLVSRIEAQLADTGSGIDLTQSALRLLRQAGSGDARTLVPGSLDNDNAANVWWQLQTPLKRSGEDDGLYVVEVTAVDKAGNIEAKPFLLRYDTQAPAVDSIQATTVDSRSINISTGTLPTLVEVPIHQLRIELADIDGSGIDLLGTAAQLIRPNGTPLGTTQQDNGISTIFLAFNPLRADGTDDGRYTIQVTPTDQAGNTFQSPLEFQFFYGTRKPEVVSTTPAEFSFVTQLPVVSATLKDNSGEGIDLDRSTIRLNAPDGSPIAGRQRKDEAQSTLFWELTNPPPRNGTTDGQYTIRLEVFDRANNRHERELAFVYDTRIPQITSVVANSTPATTIESSGLAVVSQSFTEIVITLSDHEVERASVPVEGEQATLPVSGVDFSGTAVQLLAPDGTPLGINLRDDGDTQLTLSFASLRQVGTYTLQITPRDLAGNFSGHAIEYKFNIDLARPQVETVTIGGQLAPLQFVNRLDTVVATLTDISGAGLDLTSTGSTIVVTAPNGVVEGNQTPSPPNSLIWRPIGLATDGSADGRYTVTVIPKDRGGAMGTPVRYQFIFDTQRPQVVSVSPIDLTRPISYIGQQISIITLRMADVGPASFNIAEQSIELRDSNGQIVPARLTNDQQDQVFLTLTQSLATDGSDDGEYTVIIQLTDRAGNRFGGAQGVTHRMVYDTQAPTLVSTTPAEGAQIKDDLTVITATLNDRGVSGIDFTTSQLILIDPAGNTVSGKLNNDGQGKLILETDILTIDGSYRIRVLAIDRAGNGQNAPFERTFLFSTSFPAVVSTDPVTAPKEKAFTNARIEQIEVLFESNPNLSTVNLLAPNGSTVTGQQSRDGNRVIYRLAQALAQDGSDDGTYTISIVPTNNAGRRGEAKQLTFFYDTVAPDIDTEAITPAVQQPGINNALVEIRAIVTDNAPSSGINWENVDESWVKLEKIGTSLKFPASISSDRQQTLIFRLKTPLASNGSQDGNYRVTLTPKDRSGNTTKPVVYEFFYDTRPPVIEVDSLLIENRPLWVDPGHSDYPSAVGGAGGVVIQAKLNDPSFNGSPGLGVDLSRSSVTIRAPNGNPITGILTQDGADGLQFKSGPLTVQGLYQVTITSVGLDSENLGFTPTDTVSTVFLYETVKPIAQLEDFGGNTTLTDEPLPMQGTAEDIDPEPQDQIPASGVALVEIVGTGPGGVAIEPLIATDESAAEEEPWARWSHDFLPSRSGEYNLDIRVTDRSGNSATYDAVTVNFSVSLVFKGPTYVWPNPLRQSKGDLAHFSFDLNVPGGSSVTVTLNIYDFAGDLVYQKVNPNVQPRRDNDQLVTWNLQNQSGAKVARGIYIFRLEAEDQTTQNRTNAVGKILVVE